MCLGEWLRLQLSEPSSFLFFSFLFLSSKWSVTFLSHLFRRLCSVEYECPSSTSERGVGRFHCNENSWLNSLNLGAWNNVHANSNFVRTAVEGSVTSRYPCKGNQTTGNPSYRILSHLICQNERRFMTLWELFVWTRLHHIHRFPFLWCLNCVYLLQISICVLKILGTAHWSSHFSYVGEWHQPC